jgi:hypothetical protein
MQLQTQLPALEAKDPKAGPACVGVFHTVESALHAVNALRASGIQNDRISVFTPGSTPHPLSSVETSDTEQGGMGAAMAGSILGALGLGIGVMLFVPVIGAVSVLGALAAGLMGAGGIAAGAAVGSMLERKSLEGLIPVDEVYVYEDALAQGLSIVLVTPDVELAAETMQILKAAGAASIDAAKESWWVGLKDWRKLNYDAPDQEGLLEDPAYREGFEVALRHEAVGKSDVEGKADLAAERPAPFWLGYSEGRAYAHSRKILEQPSQDKSLERGSLKEPVASDEVCVSP